MNEEQPSKRQLALRTVPFPGDINANGHIFGGWVLAQMDLAGGVIAGEIAQGPVATVAINAMVFIAPVEVYDVVSIYVEVKRRGCTSLALLVEVISCRNRGREQVKVTEGIFTYVALDANHRPRPLPTES